MIHHCRCDTTPSSIWATLSHPMLPVTTPSTHLNIPACSSPVLKRGGRFPWANRKSHIRSPGMPTTDRPPATYRDGRTCSMSPPSYYTSLCGTWPRDCHTMRYPAAHQPASR
ncbi:hypothetical protein CPAR01_03819 [Colletotrichum paranaense]|uniref:Uncharacterized protein n=1 Tax=Colletotrichum paranaense TaxID=1914294 RepID=A0ABQ9SW38_9PEZI|nr:uncharacterized protein CPAR01_03819 [Colletotrichum paranaense]KAK1543186.1 hypothetical protein CPAR01_03819 [Colletotrichum paranaense]